MTHTASIVFVVDDDLSVRKSLHRLLQAAGYVVMTFASAEEFLGHPPPDTAYCVILDVRMPGLDGLALQTRLARRDPVPSLIFITGHGDIPMSVKAMKAGAVDFLAKPFHEREMLQAIEEALARNREGGAAARERAEIRKRLATLTPREREVLEHVIAGQLNKQIAAELGTVEKTVKVHRGRVMRKMQVASLADLVRLSEKAGVKAVPGPGGRIPADGGSPRSGW